MNEIEIKLYNKKIYIKGYLDLNNLMITINMLEENIKCMNDIDIDFKNLHNSNSAALLFIINSIRYSMKNKKNIKFLNISDNLLELSKVYNLYDIIIKKIKED